MLRREIYMGLMVWNKSRWVKVPGTNRRVRRPRPREEWKVIERSDLRIVGDDVWQTVQRKNAATMKKYGRIKGLLPRGQTVPYVLSGLLRCGVCGANLVIVSGRGGKYARYGCSQHFNRGACQNSLTVHAETVEEIFFREIQQYALRSEALDFACREFLQQLDAALAINEDRSNCLLARKGQLEKELQRFADAIAEGISATSVKQAITEREKELTEIDQQISTSAQRVRFSLDEVKNFVATKIFDLTALLRVDKMRTKSELMKHVSQVRLTPSSNENGNTFYIAEGRWDLLGSSDDAPSEPSRRVRVETNPRKQKQEGDAEICCVRVVAGGGFEPPTFGL